MFSYDESISAEKVIEASAEKNLMCCFGAKLHVPEITAVRPRSFGVVLMRDCFVVSFVQAPSPVANASMIEWVEAIENR